MEGKDYVSYELALKLKECGFDVPCSHYYSKEDASDDEVWFTSCSFSPEDWNNGRSKEPDFLKPLCSAPTLWEAQKWLMSKGIFVDVSCYGRRLLNPDGYSCKDVVEWAYELKCTKTGDYINDDDYWYDNYNACLSSGIDAALEILGKKV